MLKLLTPLLLLGLAGCNSSSYPSEAQAKEACESWKQKGEVIPYSYTYEDLSFSHIGVDGLENFDKRIVQTENKRRNRACRREGSTNQYIGSQGVFSKAEKAKKNTLVGGIENSPKATDWKIVKHFRF